VIKAALVALAVLVAFPAAAATWDIDTSHSQMTFTARHLKYAKVKGNFKVWSGTVVLDEKDITKSTVDVKFDVKSIDSGNETRDNDLRGDSFFQAEKFPHATFKSTKIEKLKDNILKMTGDLTIKETTKPVTFEVEMSPEFKDGGGRPHVAFQGGELTINRQEFGLKFNKLAEGSKIVSDEIVLNVEIELKNKK